MGYTTVFNGQAELQGEASLEMVEFVNKLSYTRRMKRKLPPLYGTDGEFYVLGKGYHGQDKEDNIVDYNTPPSTQPSLWCQWKIYNINNGFYLRWDESEKFYGYIDWLCYLIERVFMPYEVMLIGDIQWEGEEDGDVGTIELAKRKQAGRISQVIQADGYDLRNYFRDIRFSKLDFNVLLGKDKDRQMEFGF